MIAPTWRRRWDEVTPFLAFPAEIRRAIYTTNAIEALDRPLRKVLKTRGHMPNEQAALKLLYMAVQNAQKNWGGRDRRGTQRCFSSRYTSKDAFPNDPPPPASSTENLTLSSSTRCVPTRAWTTSPLRNFLIKMSEPTPGEASF
jgi:hypothetical protein